jgi:hypothetical protein
MRVPALVLVIMSAARIVIIVAAVGIMVVTPIPVAGTRMMFGTVIVTASVAIAVPIARLGDW